MNAFVVGIYGVFLVMVGAKMRSGELIDTLKSDVGGFVPWGVAIATLAAMSENEATRGMVKPFVYLLILNFVLVNFDTVRNEFNKLTK